MKRLLYTGAFRFPEGDAAAFRVYSVAKLFEEAGYTVAFAGWEKRTDQEGFYQYKGHNCYSQGEFRDREQRALGRLAGFFFRGSKTAKWLGRTPVFDVIVAYNPPAIFAIRLMVMCKFRGIRLVLDNTEWYEGEHLPLGRFGPAAFENFVRMRLAYPLFKNVICISTYLDRYFSRRNTVNIPPLVDDSEIDTPTGKSLDSAIHFLYAGEAGKKDRLHQFIKALPAMHERLRKDVVLEIAGMEWEALKAVLASYGMDPGKYAPFVRCHGRVSRQRVKELYAGCHFSVLFRENKRYAKAGFPTKAMESWANGCPVIANPVGDIGIVARDRVDSILVDENDMESQIVEALRAIVELGSYTAMSMNCIDKADRLFSSAAHKVKFCEFVAIMEES